MARQKAAPPAKREAVRTASKKFDGQCVSCRYYLFNDECEKENSRLYYQSRKGPDRIAWMAPQKTPRTGPQADPTTILARLTPEERAWVGDLVDRLHYVESTLEWLNLNTKMVKKTDEEKVTVEKATVYLPGPMGALAIEVRKVKGFLQDVLAGYPRPGCAHRENPVPEPTCKKGGK